MLALLCVTESVGLVNSACRKDAEKSGLNNVLLALSDRMTEPLSCNWLPAPISLAYVPEKIVVARVVSDELAVIGKHGQTEVVCARAAGDPGKAAASLHAAWDVDDLRRAGDASGAPDLRLL